MIRVFLCLTAEIVIGVVVANLAEVSFDVIAGATVLWLSTLANDAAVMLGPVMFLSVIFLVFASPAPRASSRRTRNHHLALPVAGPAPHGCPGQRKSRPVITTPHSMLNITSDGPGATRSSEPIFAVIH